ncbi:hypothetical protein HUE58_01550 [Candidatus Ruthia endofausta]|uniref:Uncharacterized protein n=1 Tax=Candidatus Ruthia endofausta TaxID=2738852 RepID=A0A6N0HNE7_9GAMM|nr:hypothetical protein [Candidatus Ruthia endofausta]QKQ23889.1 hypothetical protein HUE58_01550 [Candidatus Ruthia endofausta]
MIEKIHRLFPERYRQYLLNNDELPNALKHYLSYPLISKQTLIKDIEFLVLDFETTGLSAK